MLKEKKESKASNLIDSVLKGDSVFKTITEATVIKGERNQSVSIVPDDDGKVKGIVEKHMKALATELDKDKIKYDVHINNGYGSISWGRGY